MRTFVCTCGNTLFFENTRCLACGSEVGWCPGCQTITRLVPNGTGGYRCGNNGCGIALQKCHNYRVEEVCNRMVATTNSGTLCDYCRFNDTIPDLSIAGNRERWYRLEAGKRRLLYSLDRLRLPYGRRDEGYRPGLSFDFKADIENADPRWQSMGRSERVYTGHSNGKITINLREAEPAEREKLRVDFHEAHRTIIGHFRHEIAHYYWQMLIKDQREEAFRHVFGDHDDPPYADALRRHYRHGPPADWPSRYVSAYASVHAWEDFAETFATYLDIISVIDTAGALGMASQVDPVDADLEPMIELYQRIGLVVNEINREMGLIDLVPEVFVSPVVDKVRFVHNLIREVRS